MRIQALKKASKERERKMQKERELLRAKRELEALRNKHQKLCNEVQKYSIFNKYLEDVVKISQVSLDVRETDHGLKEGLTWVLNLEEISKSREIITLGQTQRPQMGWEEVPCNQGEPRGPELGEENQKRM